MKVKKITQRITSSLLAVLLITSSLSLMAQNSRTTPPVPVISGDLSVCQGDDAVLSATAEADEVRWYSKASQGTLLHTGLELILENLVENTSVWAESVNVGSDLQSFTGGARVDPGTYTGAAAVSTYSKPWGLRFTISQDIILDSVDVFIASEDPGVFVIHLQDADYNILEQKTVNLPAGNATEPLKYTVTLDFEVPAGEHYSLVSPSSPKLVREGASYHPGYPYPLGDVGYITQGMLQNVPGAANAATYYFFYNWSFSVLEESISDRVRADIIVNDIPEIPVGDENQDFTQGQTLNDLDVQGSNLTWYADSNGEEVLEGTTELIDGTTYYVSQTIEGCSSDLLAITVSKVTGINEVGSDRINIYPVPASDVLFINSIETINSIEIFNTIGQSVKRVNSNEINGGFYIGDLASGIYVIQMSTSSEVITKRIIKK